MERRDFFQRLLCASYAATLVPQSAAGNDAATPDQQFPIAIFAKVFQSHTFAELAAVVAETNADGIEATIRGGGHIEPANAESQVPEMVAALAKRDKRLLIAATDINHVSSDSERLLKTLSDHGVTYYRTGYFKYRPGVPLLSQVRAFSRQVNELAELNRTLGMTALYQNHAGKDYVGNLIWDLAILLDDVSPEHFGVALDLRHLRAEIGGSYQVAVEAIRPNLRTIYLKDTSRTGVDGSQLKEVPLGTGMVTRDLFANAWRSMRPAPLAVHVEYLGQRPIAVSDQKQVVDAYRRDVATLRSWMA